MHEATSRLVELSLSEKEARVYLALLELGSAPVQEIAEKADVNRSTTYLALEALCERGLASSTTEQKRVMFTAESPERLRALASRERERLQSVEQRIEESLPTFMALFRNMNGKPQVRYFDGDAGIATVRDILSHGSGEFMSFTAIDEGTVRMSKVHEEQRLRMARQVSGRCLMALKPGHAMPMFDAHRWQLREIPYEQSPFTGEVNIVDDKVAAFMVTERPMAFLVENKEMAQLFRVMFNAAWQTSRPMDIS